MSGFGAPRTDANDTHAGHTALRWQVSGIVQGVGFRPFVYRLATACGLSGWVKNCTGYVEIVACASPGRLQRFERDLIARAPAIARPVIDACTPIDVPDPGGFRILESENTADSDIHVPTDYFVCADCLAELSQPGDRRYRYPFINCTQCGPRYTLIEALPYDRANTSMSAFALCPDCKAEYTDAGDRRFHAEPVACPVCGPALSLHVEATCIGDTQAALAACCDALRAGRIVAVKGVGGYHLLCDAANARAVARLRERKPRAHKPLALMFPEDETLQAVGGAVTLTPDEQALLRSPVRPIVLGRRCRDSAVAEGIAPGLDEVGVMLPYSPLHHLLLNAFGAPLVATSANISGEPVLTDGGEVAARLAHVAECRLDHDRPIVRPADDPVYRSIAGRPRPLRLGRGNAPLELRLAQELAEPVLALGGHMKNTLCLAWGRRAVISPHIGDMGTPRSLQVFEQLVDDLQRLYGVTARRFLCDLHPAYATSLWARGRDLPVTPIQHHAAHASALLGERAEAPRGDVLVFTWDGVGLGDDGSLWGGEALYGAPGRWQRVASWRPLRLPGGDKVSREPWRSAVSVAWELGDERLARALLGAATGEAGAEARYTLLYQAWLRGINAPASSAVGRLFDAAAALGGVCLHASFEGQGPMWLEARADARAGPIAVALAERGDGVLESDWRALFAGLIDVNDAGGPVAAVFHESLAEALLQQVLAVARTRPVAAVGLCGGVFQNRRLSEACLRRLQAHRVPVLLGRQLPVNDAGLSFGQVVEYANRPRGET